MIQFHAQNLSCRRANRLIFEHVDFHLTQGEVMGLKGGNGSGKTSLLKICAGLLEPFSGMVQNPYDFHYIGHQNGLSLALTPIENLMFLSRLMQVKPKKSQDLQNLLSILEQWGLCDYAHIAVAHLSQGQKRALALARLQLANRKLWLLDEPYMALDKKRARLLDELIKAHCDGGGLIIIADHHAFDEELTANSLFGNLSVRQINMDLF